MPEVSIILPVYNVAAYLPRCVSSILEQTFTDFELIVVDDASTDASAVVVQRLLEATPGLTWTLVTHPVNRGLAAARNSGIAEAKGKYLYFPDSDDYLEPALLSTTHRRMEETGADIVLFGLRTVEDVSGAPLEEDLPAGHEDMTGTQALFSLLEGTCRTYVCTQLFRRELFGSIRFPEGFVYEDRFTLPYLFMTAARISFIPAVYYNYRQRAGSITKSFRPEMIHNAGRIAAMATELSGAFPGADWQRAILRFKYRNLYSIVLVALLRGGTYRRVKPIWRECRRHIRLTELQTPGVLEGNPGRAFRFFKTSPRLFWIFFRRYYVSRHRV